LAEQRLAAGGPQGSPDPEHLRQKTDAECSPDPERHPVIGYIVQRLVHAIPVLIGISILSFLMLHLIPGDPVTVFAGDKPLTP
jgi:hypothetical protein